MNTIDVTLIQQALRNIERALEATKAAHDPIQALRISLDLMDARQYLRVALVGNTEEAA